MRLSAKVGSLHDATYKKGRRIMDIRHVNGGTQYLLDIGKGRQVSIVQHPLSYGGMVGLWEAAMLEGDGVQGVEGWLDMAAVLAYVERAIAK